MFAMLATLSRKQGSVFENHSLLHDLIWLVNERKAVSRRRSETYSNGMNYFIGFTEYDKERFKWNTNIALRFFIASTIPWTSFISLVTETELDVDFVYLVERLSVIPVYTKNWK